MSARELDPAVWAAVYGTTYAQQAEAVRLAGAEGNAFGINVERCSQVADDAVLSLHPLGFDGRHEILDRIARATVHPEALRPPLPLPERAPETPAARLGALVAAERAYLLAAGWAEHPQPAGQAPAWTRDGLPLMARSTAIAEQYTADALDR